MTDLTEVPSIEIIYSSDDIEEGEILDDHESSPLAFDSLNSNKRKHKISENVSRPENTLNSRVEFSNFHDKSKRSKFRSEPLKKRKDQLQCIPDHKLCLATLAKQGNSTYFHWHEKHQTLKSTNSKLSDYYRSTNRHELSLCSDCKQNAILKSEGTLVKTETVSEPFHEKENKESMLKTRKGHHNRRTRRSTSCTNSNSDPSNDRNQRSSKDRDKERGHHSKHDERYVNQSHHSPNSENDKRIHKRNKHIHKDRKGISSKSRDKVVKNDLFKRVISKSASVVESNKSCESSLMVKLFGVQDVTKNALDSTLQLPFLEKTQICGKLDSSPDVIICKEVISIDGSNEKLDKESNLTLNFGNEIECEGLKLKSNECNPLQVVSDISSNIFDSPNIGPLQNSGNKEELIVSCSKNSDASNQKPVDDDEIEIIDFVKEQPECVELKSSDEDEELEELRIAALLTKDKLDVSSPKRITHEINAHQDLSSKQIQECDNEQGDGDTSQIATEKSPKDVISTIQTIRGKPNFDNEEMQLRLAALHSAIIKKHKDRLQKGILPKKKANNESDLFEINSSLDDIEADLQLFETGSPTPEVSGSTLQNDSESRSVIATCCDDAEELKVEDMDLASDEDDPCRDTIIEHAECPEQLSETQYHQIPPVLQYQYFASCDQHLPPQVDPEYQYLPPEPEKDVVYNVTRSPIQEESRLYSPHLCLTYWSHYHGESAENIGNDNLQPTTYQNIVDYSNLTKADDLHLSPITPSASSVDQTSRMNTFDQIPPANSMLINPCFETKVNNQGKQSRAMLINSAKILNIDMYEKNGVEDTSLLISHSSNSSVPYEDCSSVDYTVAAGKSNVINNDSCHSLNIKTSRNMEEKITEIFLQNACEDPLELDEPPSPAKSLSDMIVLDEIGLSPNAKRKGATKYKRKNKNYDDEDEHLLREKLLKSLAKCPKDKEKYKVVERDNVKKDSDRPDKRKSKTYGKKEHNAVEGGITPSKNYSDPLLSKEFIQPKDIDISLNRSVTPSESLQIIIPNAVDSKIKRQPVVKNNLVISTQNTEQSSSNNQRFIINLQEDSETDEENFWEEDSLWTRHVTITDPPKLEYHQQISSGPVVQRLVRSAELPPSSPLFQPDFEESVDKFLRDVRRTHETAKFRLKKQINCKKEVRITRKVLPTSREINKKAVVGSVASPGTPLAVRHLPVLKQEEYRRLKQQIAERERLLKNNTLQKPSVSVVTLSNEQSKGTTCYSAREPELKKIFDVTRQSLDMGESIVKTVSTSAYSLSHEESSGNAKGRFGNQVENVKHNNPEKIQKINNKTISKSHQFVISEKDEAISVSKCNTKNNNSTQSNENSITEFDNSSFHMDNSNDSLNSERNMNKCNASADNKETSVDNEINPPLAQSLALNGCLSVPQIKIVTHQDISMTLSDKGTSGLTEPFSTTTSLDKMAQSYSKVDVDIANSSEVLVSADCGTVTFTDTCATTLVPFSPVPLVKLSVPNSKGDVHDANKSGAHVLTGPVTVTSNDSSLVQLSMPNTESNARITNTSGVPVPADPVTVPSAGRCTFPVMLSSSVPLVESSRTHLADDLHNANTSSVPVAAGPLAVISNSECPSLLMVSTSTSLENKSSFGKKSVSNSEVNRPTSSSLKNKSVVNSEVNRSAFSSLEKKSVLISEVNLSTSSSLENKSVPNSEVNQPASSSLEDKSVSQPTLSMMGQSEIQGSNLFTFHKCDLLASESAPNLPFNCPEPANVSLSLNTPTLCQPTFNTEILQRLEMEQLTNDMKLANENIPSPTELAEHESPSKPSTKPESNKLMEDSLINKMHLEKTIEKVPSSVKSVEKEQQLSGVEVMLLSERCVMINTLSEFIRLLDVIRESRREVLGAAGQVARLQRELAAAEKSLATKRESFNKLKRSVHPSHMSLTEGRNKITMLAKMCKSLGHEIRGDRYLAPLEGADLLEEKVREMKQKSAMLNSECSQKKTNNLPIVVNTSKKLKTTEAGRKQSSSEVDKVLGISRVCTSQQKKDLPEIEDTLVKENRCREIYGQTNVNIYKGSESNRCVNGNVTDAAHSLLGKRRAEENKSEKEPNSCDSVQSKLKKIDICRRFSNYRSPLLHLSSVSSRSQPRSVSKPDAQGVLCPFELMGSCRDDDCQYVHHKSA